MRILAIDPGLVTGMAVWSSGAFVSSEVTPRQEVYAYLNDKVEIFDVVLIERYDISARTAKLSSQMDALYLIGAAEALCYLSAAKFIISGRDAKGFSTDAKLKALGWHTPTKGGHANDAARHLLRYLAVTVKEPSIVRTLGEVFG